MLNIFDQYNNHRHIYIYVYDNNYVEYLFCLITITTMWNVCFEMEYLPSQ